MIKIFNHMLQNNLNFNQSLYRLFVFFNVLLVKLFSNYLVWFYILFRINLYNFIFRNKFTASYFFIWWFCYDFCASGVHSSCYNVSLTGRYLSSQLVNRCLDIATSEPVPYVLKPGQSSSADRSHSINFALNYQS